MGRPARCPTRRSAAAGLRRPTLITGSLLEPSHSHLSAEFLGVPSEQLCDAKLLGGLLIAAASAAGFGTLGVPVVREHADGSVSSVLLLDSGHIVIHSVPRRQILLFDIVAPAAHDFRKALEVLSRRLTTRDVKTVTRGRG